MEYFVGAAITILSYVVANKIIKRDLKSNENIVKITYTQSHIFNLMKPYMEYAPSIDDSVPRQSMNFLKNAYMKVMVVKNKAYWIKDNTFYVSDVVDGEVVKENARVVDTMSMNKVELDEMMFIVEKLREDDNDHRGSGKS